MVLGACASVAAAGHGMPFLLSQLSRATATELQPEDAWCCPDGRHGIRAQLTPRSPINANVNSSSNHLAFTYWKLEFPSLTS